MPLSPGEIWAYRIVIAAWIAAIVYEAIVSTGTEVFATIVVGAVFIGLRLAIVLTPAERRPVVGLRAKH